MDMLFFVYILTNRPRGVLCRCHQRSLQADLGTQGEAGAWFTKTYGIALLVYYEEFASVVEARARERAIKRWRREWKMALVEKANPDCRDLANEFVP